MFDITSRVVDLLGVGKIESGQAAFTSDADLTAAGIRKVPASASMSSDSEATAAAVRTSFGAAALAAESGLSAAATATLYVSMTGDFDAVLSGTGNATYKSLTATLTVQSAVTADGAILCGGTAALSSDSELVAAGIRETLAAADLSQGSHLGGPAVRIAFGVAALTSDVSATVSAAPVRIRFGEAALSGDVTTTSATAHVKVFGVADLSGSATSFTATASPVFRLIMATAERSITDDWLLRRYPIDVGLSLLVTGATVTEVEVPSQTELAEADYYFLGGRNNPITAAQRAVLVAAGYGSYIEED